jgi:hypothetical protein
MPEPTNPYAPVTISSEPLDDEATVVNFRVTKSLLRHGEDHYLLHAHPIRLLFCSLAMIFASGAAFIWSARHGQAAYWMTAVTALGLSTLIYLALVHHTKMKVRRKLREHGILVNTACSVAAIDNQLMLTSSNGEERWPVGDLELYRTPRGTLICPEPHFFIYVPRNNNSPREAYKSLRANIQRS